MSGKKKVYRPNGFLYNALIAGDPEREQRYEETRKKVFLGIRLHNLRKKAGLAKQEVATKAGVTAYRITRLEAGDYDGDIPKDIVERVIRVIGCALVLSEEECFV